MPCTHEYSSFLVTFLSRIVDDLTPDWPHDLTQGICLSGRYVFNIVQFKFQTTSGDTEGLGNFDRV